MSDKTLLLLTGIASILVGVQACFVPSGAMIVAMIANAVFSFVMAFKIGKKGL